MQALNLPLGALKLSRKDGVIYVLCEIRKKKLVLTPEEWVRQHFLHFMINDLGISKGRIVSEMALKYNDMNRRGDIVVLGDEGQAIMLIECKAPEINITKKTLHQIATYNSVFKVPLLVMTNGLDHHVLNFRDGEMKYSRKLEDLILK
jgi:hypothetical protein